MINETKYKKVEEHVFSSDKDFPAAKDLADNLFSPFRKEGSTDRDSQEAKVRIRRRPEGGFRVILYHHAGQLEKKQEVVVEDAAADPTPSRRKGTVMTEKVVGPKLKNSQLPNIETLTEFLDTAQSLASGKRQIKLLADVIKEAGSLWEAAANSEEELNNLLVYLEGQATQAEMRSFTLASEYNRGAAFAYKEVASYLLRRKRSIK